MSVVTASRDWVSGRVEGTPDKPCPRGCGAAFYTGVGLDEHARVGCGSGNGSPVTVRRRWQITKHGQAILRQTGTAVAARNNARRFRCAECPTESTPSGIGSHQRYTGHNGRIELT